MYYGLIMIAVTMFGIQFYCNREYQRICGGGLFATMVMTFGGGIAGLLSLLIINGFALDYTPFTLLMATIASLNGIACGICSQKALGHVSLALYSVFSQLGGMAIPFVTGIIFFDEDLTLGKIICLITVIAAMFISMGGKADKSQKGSKYAVFYYMGVFFFNGMSGFLSKIFAASTLPKTNAAMYSVMNAAVSIVISGIAVVVMLIMAKKKRASGVEVPRFKLTTGAVVWMSGGTILNKVANYFLLIALAMLPASVQYPMVTGGIMIVSTLLSYLTSNKPSKREWLVVALSFAGILALVLI